MGCIGGFSGCWRAYWRGQCLSAALQESAVLSLYRCRQLLAMNGGCGLHRRVQRLLAVVLGGSMFIGGLAGVGGIVIVSVSAVVGDRRRLWAALAGSVAVGGRLGGVNVYRRHCRSRRYYHCISVGSCWRSSAVVGCIVGFSGCWGAYWRGQCLSAALQESAVLSLYRCRQMLATVGGCGLHWRVQWLLAGVLAGSMFIGGIAGVGGIIVVSVSAIVGDERRLWSASAGSAAVGSHIGGVTVYRRHCRSRRCYHCIGVGSCWRSSAVVGCIGGFSGCWRAYWRGQCLSAACMSRRYYHCLGVIFELFQFFN